MSTKSLLKKEEAELNNTLTKITIAKLESHRPASEVDHSENKNEKIEVLEEDLTRIRDKENKIKAERYALYQER